MNKSNLGAMTPCNFSSIVFSYFSKLFLILLVSLSWSFSAKGQFWDQTQKILSDTPSSQTKFGRAVAISGNYAVTVDEDWPKYVVFYKYSGNSWIQQTKLLIDFGYSDVEFSVAISAHHAVVGMYSDTYASEGKVYVFKKVGDQWSEQAVLQENDGISYEPNAFGSSVAIYDKTIVVGAEEEDDYFNEGAAYIFTLDGSTWRRKAKITASDKQTADRFGKSVAISGDYIVVGAYIPGKAYVFKYNNGTWAEQAKLDIYHRLFGYSVAIEGDNIAVGAPSGFSPGVGRPGVVVLYKRVGTSWVQKSTISASDKEEGDAFGSSVALSGDYLVVGAPDEDTGGDKAGAAYIFKNDGTNWNQEAKIRASDGEADNQFGLSLGISGERMIVGSRLKYSGNTDAFYFFSKRKPPQNQTISFNPLAEKTYGNRSFNLAATSSSGLPVAYTTSNPAVATVSGNTVTIVGAGTVSIIASQTGNNEYVAATEVSQKLVVKKAVLTVIANNQKRYAGNVNPAFTFRYVGFVNGDNQTALSVQPQASTQANNTSQAGVYFIRLNGGAATNYTFQYILGKLTILDKILLTITANNQSKVYGEVNPTLTFSMTGFVDGENRSVLDVMPTISTKTTTKSDVGTYEIKIEGGQDDKYKFQYNTGILTIEKASQSIIFDIGLDSTKVLGDPSFTLQATGGTSSNPVTFTSANNDVATISGNEVTLKGVGVIAIYANQAGSQNYLAAPQVAQLLVVRDSIQTPTALPQTLSNGTLSLFPNPISTSKKLWIRVNGKINSAKVHLTILNTQGQIVRTFVQSLKNGLLEMSTKALTSGQYLLKIRLGKETVMRRIVVIE